MTDAWYENKNVRNRLTIFGRAIQGVAPYKVIIEPDPTKCQSGCCSFGTRRITVNPTLFAASPKEQYHLTKALLVHEAGHRRYTTPTLSLAIAGEVANILEDERVERLMCSEFVGVRWLIYKLAERFCSEARSVDRTCDSSNEVVSYFLQLRWATRIGQPVKGELSAKNLVLWEKVKPLVREAWEAETFEIVSRNAAKIVDILKLQELKIHYKKHYSKKEVR
jgi:hypothetical protein